jgi:uncharacterized protein YggE
MFFRGTVMSKYAWCVVLWFGFAAAASAQVGAIPTVPHLLVKGEATRSVVPDRFEVTLTLGFTDPEPLQARTRVEHALADALRAYRESRALKNSVDATTFTIEPDYAYENDRRVFKGTRATRTVHGEFATADDVRTFLSKVHTDENVLLSGIRSTRSDEAKVREELKREAMRQTRESARLLADAYGTRITGLYSASDVAPDFAYGIKANSLPPPPQEPSAISDTPSPMDQSAMPAGAPASVVVGTIVLTERLYAVFLIGE